MGAPGMEVVSRAIQVDRQQENRVVAVLLPVGLRLHQKHLLRKTVRRVGLLRITTPQVVLAEWNGRELRIGAHRTDSDKFGNAGAPRSIEQLYAHQQIVIKELRRSLAIRTDTPDDGGQMNNDRRPH